MVGINCEEDPADCENGDILSLGCDDMDVISRCPVTCDPRCGGGKFVSVQEFSQHLYFLF